MTREFVRFECEGEMLQGTLHSGRASAGLLIVSGGNEIRSGAFASQTMLAEVISAAGFPVFRFDRRGIGDSDGTNGGFRSSGPDIAAALACFRRLCPAIQRVVGFGNCDAGSALMLAGGSNCDALVLANPWTFDDGSAEEMPAAAIRARYAKKLADPREWKRLLIGGVSLEKLIVGLGRGAKRRSPTSGLAQEMRSALSGFRGSTSYVVAGRDRTGLAFKAGWPDAEGITVRTNADHAFSAPDDRDWLRDVILSVLQEQAGKLDMG